MKKLSLLLVVFLFAVGYSYGQRTVSGTITDTDGLALIGANVTAKGTTVGTITDIDGNFSLAVPDNVNELEVSYTGYDTQIINIDGQSNFVITMSEGELLDEVVITALGIEKEEKTLGYSVDQIDSEELTKARSTNIVNSLQGKVTGVQITNTGGNLGTSSKITIRGATSLSGRNNPLWVIDGMPFNDSQIDGVSSISGNRDFGNGAQVVNPDDIESMSILKGAAATALYGSRAAAGAIIVTTKRGKASKDGRARVELNSSMRWDDMFVVPQYQQDYAMGAQAKYDSSSVGFDWGPLNVGQTVNSLPVTGETGPLQKFDNNGVQDFFETGLTRMNNIAVSDGNERMDYRVSVGALNQTGIVPGSELDRYNISLNAGVKHSDRLNTRFGVQFIKTDSKGTAAQGANDPNIIGLSSFSSTLDQNIFKEYIDDAGNQINQTTPTSNNPYWIRNANRNDRDDTRVLANMQASYELVDNLTLTGKVGYDFGQDNRFITNRKGTAQVLEGDYLIDNINQTQFNTDIIANYVTDVNDDISINVLGGFNYNKRKTEREGLFGQNLLVPELFDPGNAELNVPSRGFSEQALFGLYGSVDVGYKDFATLTLTGRNDWSSTLPADNRSYFYPSASLAFIFTEAFELSNDVLNYGKLRASFAQVGNDTNPYLLDFNFNPITTARGQYGLNVNFPFDGNLAFAKSNRLPPSDLRPEQQTSWELGTELDFFDYRLGVDFAYFNSRNEDQILALPIPESTGFASLVTNVGRVDTKGFEFTIDAVPLKFGSFQWNTMVNYTKSTVEVVELAEGVDRVLISSAFNSVQVVAEEGAGFELLAIPFARVPDSITEWAGRPIINPDTGTRLAGETKTLGSVLPDFTMGFVNSFDFGNFNASFTIDWRSGGVMKSSTVENLQTGGLVQETLLNRDGTFIDMDGVIDNGDGTYRQNDVPVANAQAFWTSLDDNSVGEPFIYDASFVKLREVALNYTLPKSLLGDTFIQGVTVGVEARNVMLLWSKVPHIDPESNLFGSGQDGWGVERASTPGTRSVGFNVRATF